MGINHHGRKLGAKNRLHRLPGEAAIDLDTPTARYYIRVAQRAISEGRGFPFGPVEDASVTSLEIWAALNGYLNAAPLRKRIDAMLAGERIDPRDRYDPMKLRRLARDHGLNNNAIARGTGYSVGTVSNIMHGNNAYAPCIRTLGVDKVERYIREHAA